MAELFANFEVNREPRWQVISKLLAGSLAFHMLAWLCVVYVPGVRHAFNIATLIAGANVVDRPYERTEITDDIQFVDLAREKFHYPPGYFAIEGQMPVVPLPVPPAQIGPQFTAQAPPLTVSPEIGPSLSPSPTASPVTPAIASSSPSPQANASPSPAGAAVAKANKPGATPSPVPSPSVTAEQGQSALDKTAKENNLTLPKENEINKKPLKDFASYANDLKKQGKLDINKPFEIVIEAELDENGKLKDPKITKKSGDENLVDLFGRMVAALNDSGFLSYLKLLDSHNTGSKVVFTIKQGETDVLASVESEATSEESARSMAPVLNKLLSAGADSRKGKDEEVLLRNTSAEPNGKKIVFNFTMPRQAVVDLIKKQLEAPDKPS